MMTKTLCLILSYTDLLSEVQSQFKRGFILYSNITVVLVIITIYMSQRQVQPTVQTSTLYYNHLDPVTQNQSGLIFYISKCGSTVQAKT